MHTFTYQKLLLHALFLVVFKIAESLQCILHKKVDILDSTIISSNILSNVTRNKYIVCDD